MGRGFVVAFRRYAACRIILGKNRHSVRQRELGDLRRRMPEIVENYVVDEHVVRDK